jgi:hypothetical protein
MTAYNFVAVQASRFFPGEKYSVEFQYTLGGAFVNGDTITIPANSLPINGIKIAEVEVLHKPLDTNATPTMTYSVGDSGLSTRFISAAGAGDTITTVGHQIRNAINIPQGKTAGVVTTGTGYLYGAGTSPQLILTVDGVVATGATTGTVRMVVHYYCAEEN